MTTDTKTRLSELVQDAPAEAQQLAPLTPPAPKQTVLSRPEPAPAVVEFEQSFTHSEAIGLFILALAKAQGQFKTIERTLTAKVKSKRTGQEFSYDYAPLDVVLDAVREPLAAQEIAVMQFPSARKGSVTVITLLAHSSGQWFRGKLSIGGPDDGNPQEVGSAVTYARRYAIESMLGISPAHDDDAQGVSDPFRAGNGAPVRQGPVQMPQRAQAPVPPQSAAAASPAPRPSTAPPPGAPRASAAGFTVQHIEPKVNPRGTKFWVVRFSNGVVASVFSTSKGGQELGEALTRAHKVGTVYADAIITRKNGYAYIEEVIPMEGDASW